MRNSTIESFQPPVENQGNSSDNDPMRGKRKLRKIEVLSTEAVAVYECDACAWMLNAPAERTLSEIETEFDDHDCKKNALGKRPVPNPS
jgi:hypothetical protein